MGGGIGQGMEEEGKERGEKKSDCGIQESALVGRLEVAKQKVQRKKSEGGEEAAAHGLGGGSWRPVFISHLG